MVILVLDEDNIDELEQLKYSAYNGAETRMNVLTVDFDYYDREFIEQDRLNTSWTVDFNHYDVHASTMSQFK